MKSAIKNSERVFSTFESSIRNDSAPEFLEKLVQEAEKMGASDIHLQSSPQELQITFRIDGVMNRITEIPKSLAEWVLGRIKFLSKLKTYQESLPQDGRIEKKDIGTKNDIRVSTYPTVTGEKAVLRLFTQTAPKSLKELDLNPDLQREIESFLNKNSGLLLLTGPAGSGKTTTIYSCLRWLADNTSRHIVTIEDPAEQIIPGIMQTETNIALDLTFGKALRHLLRQDPEVITVGEIRDEETANLAVRATLTGHMVISTLHAGSCKGVFERLQTLCDDKLALWSGIELVLNQRLVRKVCPECEAAGCGRCAGIGYKGVIPIVEWIRVEENLRKKIREQGLDEIKPVIRMEDCARELVSKGITTESEIKRGLAYSC